MHFCLTCLTCKYSGSFLIKNTVRFYSIQINTKCVFSQVHAMGNILFQSTIGKIHSLNLLKYIGKKKNIAL